MVDNVAIHRLVEQQAAAQANKLAFVDEERAWTYRDVNVRANATARALLASGFRRGSLATVRLQRSSDLLVALLAVLKAGGAYLRLDPHDHSWPLGISIPDRAGRGENRCVLIDVSRVLAEETQASPNLPIIARGSDLACATPDGMLIPHSTIAALRQHDVKGDVVWSRESSEIDVWVALMAGATVTLTAAPVRIAA